MNVRFRHSFYQSPADDGTSGSAGGGGGGTPAASAPAQTFTLDYVRELREEAKATRLKLLEAEQKAKTAEEAVTKAQSESTERVTAAEKAANDKLLRAELKALAVKAGIADLDGLKLADLSKLKLNADGEIEGGDAFIEEFKKAKPYLFNAAAGDTSSAKGKPAPKGNEPLDARSLSKEDYEKEKRKLLGR